MSESTTAPTVWPELTPLSEDECWSLLRSAALGRLATAAKGLVDIFPVNYLVHEGTILFRTAPGSKLFSLASAPLVAFEADSFDGRWHSSVVVHGRANVLEDPSEIEASGIRYLVSWSHTPKSNFVRITPTDITGRKVDRSAFTAPDLV